MKGCELVSSNYMSNYSVLQQNDTSFSHIIVDFTNEIYGKIHLCVMKEYHFIVKLVPNDYSKKVPNKLDVGDNKWFFLITQFK